MTLRLMLIGCLSACAVQARSLRPARLAPSPYVDTEASTNLAFGLDLPSLKQYRLSVACVPTPSNNVEVALGGDADGDGRLSFEETGLSLAWDCGAWSVVGRGGETAGPVVEGPDSNGVVTATLEVGVGNHKAKPRWLYDRSWNLVRVTTRGVDAPNERVGLKTTQSGFAVIVK